MSGKASVTEIQSDTLPQDQSVPVRKRGIFLGALVIIIAGTLAYSNSFSGVMLFDDENSIVENFNIRYLSPIWESIVPPEGQDLPLRPIVYLSLALNYHFGRLNPWGYHLVNLVIHLSVGLTLFGIVRRTLRGERLGPRYGYLSTGLAMAVATLWTVHPLTTQSVTYIIQRTEALMGLFYLLTLYCFIRAASPGGSKLWSLASIVVCMFGMATKEVTATAPLMVWLYDAIFLSSPRDALKQRKKYYIALGLTWLVLVGIMAARYPLPSAGFSEHLPSAWEYARSQFGVILHYLRLAWAPTSLCLDYNWPVAQTAREILGPMAIVGILVLATAWGIWKRHPLGFLGAWFFIILAPTSSFVPIADLAFEHRMYLPLAAICTLIVVLFGDVLVRTGSRMIHSTKAASVIALTIFVAVTALLGRLTYQRNEDYASALRMWIDVTQKRPLNARAHNNLGKAMHMQGSVSSAIAEYEEALRLNDQMAEARSNLGAAYVQLNRINLAYENCHQAVEMRPEWAEAHFNLGIVLSRLGHVPEAIASYEKAISLRPQYPEAYFNLGNIYRRKNRLDEAIDAYQAALVDNPDYLEPLLNIVGVYRMKGDEGEAKKYLDEAYDLAIKSGRDARAQNHLIEALNLHRITEEIDSTRAIGYLEIGTDLEALKRYDEAAAAYRKALQHDPTLSAAQAGLDSVSKKR